MKIATQTKILMCYIFFPLVIMTGSVGVADDPIEILTKGMVAYWPLDDRTTEQAHGLDLQPKQVLSSFTNGVVGKSLRSREAADVDAGLHLPHVSALNLGELTAFTLSTWYRIDGLVGAGEKSRLRHWPGALGWYNPDDHSQYYFTTRYRKRGSDDVQSTSLTASLATPSTIWHHVVQQVDAHGNHRVWHAAINSSGHAGDPVVSEKITGFDRLAIPGEPADNSMVLGYYETKGGGVGGSRASD